MAGEDTKVEENAIEVERERESAYECDLKGKVPARRVTVLAEGDSWFSYFPATDILATLRRSLWEGIEYKIHDVARAGSTINRMAYSRDIVDVFQLLHAHKDSVEAFLFSGGGNDLAGPEFSTILHNKKAVSMNNGIAEINRAALHGVVDEIIGGAYRDFLRLVIWKAARIGKPNLPIVIHGYAYAIPDGRGWLGGWGPLPGPWLDPSLALKGYDRKNDEQLRRTMVRELIDAFNQLLMNIAAEFRRNVHYVDLRRVLTDNEWSNELHPSPDGFKKVTAEIEKRLRSVI